jgi:aspartyl-tRNA(Asn)/glutamyl-tRNA(Gln) amidotransferase subunit A
MNVHDFVHQRKAGSSIEEHTARVLEEAADVNKEYCYFNTLAQEQALKRARELDKLVKKKDKTVQGMKLLGVPLSVKDAICVAGMESTAGSRILKGYRPLFNATVIQKCLDQGAVIIGKTAQDAFGFGSFSVNVGKDFRVPLNPFDKKRSTGGSSGGCAGFTQKTKHAHASIAESTGGSIAEPASFCGVVGITPTYGRVSRYGLMDYANSMDKVGSMGKTVHDASLLLECMSGFDNNESTSLNMKQEDFSSSVCKSVKGIKVGIVKEAFKGTEKEVEKQVREAITRLEKQGVPCTEVSLRLPITHGVSTYYILAACEASTNLAKYCGIRYGQHEKLEGTFNEYFTRVRSMHFNEETKRRVMLGTFARMAGFRDAYYMKALKVRTKIVQEYKKAFKHYDALLTPSSPILPPTFNHIKDLTPLQNYMLDVLTVGPNLAGLPHMSMPSGKANNLPVGVMITAGHLQESTLIKLGSALE